MVSGKKRPERAIVCFRLDDAIFLELSRRAKALGVNPDKLARHCVQQMMRDGEDRAALRKAVDALAEQCRQLSLL